MPYHVKNLVVPLLNAGFAVISINHRSSSDAIFPAQIHDVKAAIRYVRANEVKYKLDSNFIGISGSSSGGHLAAMAGTTSNFNELEGDIGNYKNTSSQVDAVVDWFGPTDFLVMDACGSKLVHDAISSPESQLIGGAIQENKALVMAANPITYVDKNDPPFLIIHGDKDELVPHCQSELLHSALSAKKVASELIIVKNGKHGNNGVFADDNFKKMINFFNKQYESQNN
jgi:acetyl esterase/lipase